VLLLHDVTERRQVEAEKDQFLSVVSHELKTPLTTIKGLNDLASRRIKRGAPTPKVLENLQGVAHQVQRMEALIGDLLDIRRLETGTLPLVLASIDLTVVVSEACERAQSMTDRHTLRVEADRTQPLLVEADRGRIEQVLDNLLSNAIKYSPNGGTITLHLARVADQAVLRVHDEGIGIPEAGREHLFERFYRGANVQASQYGGLGIGLALSHEILNRHGGTLVLEATSARGSTFRISLPLERTA
jgi:signal transduction histidine kinase